MFAVQALSFLGAGTPILMRIFLRKADLVLAFLVDHPPVWACQRRQGGCGGYYAEYCDMTIFHAVDSLLKSDDVCVPQLVAGLPEG